MIPFPVGLVGIILGIVLVIVLHSHVKNYPSEKKEKWLVVALSLFLLIPGYFWLGHYFFGMRINEWALGAGVGGLFLLWVLRPANN